MGPAKASLCHPLFCDPQKCSSFCVSRVILKRLELSESKNEQSSAD